MRVHGKDIVGLFEERFISSNIQENIDALVVYASLLGFQFTKYFHGSMYNYTNKFWKGEKIVYRFSVKNTFDSVTFCHLEIGLNDNIEVDEEIVLNNILTAYDVLDKKMKG